MKKLIVSINALLFVIIGLTAQPEASFTYSPGLFYDGCSGSAYDFQSTSTGNIVAYDWSSGNGGTSTWGSLYEQYSSPLTEPEVYECCLTVTDDMGLQDTYCEDIVIYPNPIAGLLTDTLCQGESIVVNGTTYDEARPYGEEYLESYGGCDSIIYVNLRFSSEFQITNRKTRPVPYQETIGGSIEFDVICGTEPYTYQWSPAIPGAQNEVFDLSAGLYTVTVTDANNNIDTKSFEVLQGGEIELEVWNIRDACGPGTWGSWLGGVYVIINGELSGEYNVNLIGGPPAGGAIINSMYRQTAYMAAQPATYNLSVVDENGVEHFYPYPITVTQPDTPLDAVVYPMDTTVCAGDSVFIECISSHEYLSYDWSFYGIGAECDTCSSTMGLVLVDADSFAGYGSYSVSISTNLGCEHFYNGNIQIDDACDPVWPGDTDTNTVVNNFDLLNIGLAFDATGTTRTNATLDWVAQESEDWTLSNPNGSNYKHSDTDGNGVVDANDTLGITLNWGEEHNFAGGPPNNLMPVYPPAAASVITMPFYVEPDTFIEGETLALSVILGEMGAEAENVYGIAFSLEFDPAVIVPGSIYLDFNDSWIGTINDDMISVQKAFHSDGRLDVCLTRTDQTTVTGFGQMAELFITIEDDILFHSGNSSGLVAVADGETAFNITNVLVLNNSGEQLDVITSETTSVIEDVSNVTENINETKRVRIYPNPAKDHLLITTQDLMIENLELYSLDGVLLKSIRPATERYVLDVTGLNDGIYMIRVHTAEGVVNRRIGVLR